MKLIWGEFDYLGPDHPFDITDYYQPEMGPQIRRRLLSFERLVTPESIGRQNSCATILKTICPAERAGA